MPHAMDRYRSDRDQLGRPRPDELNALLVIAAFAIIILTIALL
jgi:hypothetical protein